MKLSEKIQEALREQQEINLSDPAVQKRLAAQWGYVPAGAQPAPNVPDGWKLMPIEPTKEIYECFSAYDGTSYSNPFDFDDFRVDYGFAIEVAQETKP